MDTVTAVIPVRAGSRRIPNKNLAPFAGTTLLEHKIEVLKKVPEITRILVTSDSEKMLQIAAEHGASTHVRPAEYCDEKSLPFAETVRLVCSETEGDHILWAPCTSPLIEAETFSDAIRTYLTKQREGYDSLLAVEELKKFIWDKNHPLNYELGEKQVPSQLLPEWYTVVCGLTIIPRDKAIQWKYVYGGKVYMYKVDHITAIDIDEPTDFVIAEALYQYRKAKNTNISRGGVHCNISTMAANLREVA